MRGDGSREECMREWVFIGSYLGWRVLLCRVLLEFDLKQSYPYVCM